MPALFLGAGLADVKHPDLAVDHFGIVWTTRFIFCICRTACDFPYLFRAPDFCDFPVHQFYNFVCSPDGVSCA